MHLPAFTRGREENEEEWWYREVADVSDEIKKLEVKGLQDHVLFVGAQEKQSAGLNHLAGLQLAFNIDDFLDCQKDCADALPVGP